MKKSLLVSLLCLCFASVSFADDVPVIDASNDAIAPSAPVELNQEAPTQQFVVADDEGNDNTAKADDLSAKVTELQDEIQTLRGKLEVQEHDLKNLREQQKAFYKDLDDRMRNQGARTEISLFGKSKDEANDSAKPATQQTATNDVEAYKAAFGLLKEKQYQKAISSMEAFIKDYPDSQYQANAHYWLGELYLSQGQQDQAIEQFNLVVNTYPKSNKVAGAHLKLGFAYYDKGQWQDAKRELQTVQTQYPDTALAKIATARLADIVKQGL